jgi:hypothetical protein
MYICAKCQTEYPRTAEFFVRASKERDGLSYTCRACARAAVLSARERRGGVYRQRDQERHTANREAILARKRAQHAADPAKAARRAKVQRTQHPERHRANVRVQDAIRRGELTPWPACAVPTCAITKVEAHHADYSHPLDVVWLCRQHHRQAHASVRQSATA